MKRCLLIISLVASCLLASAQSVGDQIYALIPSGEEVYRHGYAQLSEDDKVLYDRIIEAFCHFEANNYSPYYFHRVELPDDIEIMSIYTLKDFFTLILNDVPEMFIMSSSVPGYDYTAGVSFGKVGYQNTPESYLSELQQLEAIYAEYASAITYGMTDYQRLLILHDAFINAGTYGDMYGANASNIRGAIINGRAVCEGFARAGVFLCQRAGIESIYISGKKITSTVNNTWENHSWNYVKLDGQWYMMDLSTDGGFAGVCGHSAFLKGQEYQDGLYSLLSLDDTDPNALYGTLPTLSTTDYDPNRTATELSQDEAPMAQKRLSNGRLIIRTPQGDMDVLGRIIR